MATKLIVDSLQKTGGSTFTLPASDGSNGQAIVTNGSGTLSFAAAGATITDDTSTNATRYLLWDDATSGSSTSIGVSSTKLTWNPSTGSLTATTFVGNVTGTASNNLSLSGGTLTGNLTLSGDPSASLHAATKQYVDTQASATVTLGSGTSGSYVESLVAGTGITLTNNTGAGATPTIAIGQAIGTSDSPSFTNLTVTGNLTVNGTTTTIDTTNLSVADAVIQCASGNTGASASYIGLQAERGATDAYFVWEESSDRWRATTSADGTTHTSADMQCNTLYGVSTTAQYADLAENYVADNSYAIGTVLVFGGLKEVTISDTKEDKRIAGVVSTNPAYLMNSDCEGDFVVPIALQGRVPCRVIGVVEKGDIIVSSNINGVGVAWNETRNPVAGSIIGKSLENKNTDAEEVIEVVIGVR